MTNAKIAPKVPDWVQSLSSVDQHAKGVKRGFDLHTLEDENRTLRANAKYEFKNRLKSSPKLRAGINVCEFWPSIFLGAATTILVLLLVCNEVKGKDNWSTILMAFILGLFVAVTGNFFVVRASEDDAFKFYTTK